MLEKEYNMSYNNQILDRLVNSSLYQVIEISNIKELRGLDFLIRHGGVIADKYCDQCEQDSMFKYGEVVVKTTYTPQPYYGAGGTIRALTEEEKFDKEYSHFNNLVVEVGENGVVIIKADCVRCENEFVMFLKVHLKERTVEKIGQYPSIYDFGFMELQKYQKYLKKMHNELFMAINLNSQGIGIGSYVYLRRIFEKLLEEAHDKGKANKGWDEENYKNAIFKDKLKMLKKYIPEEIIDIMRPSYTICSKGIHQLDEDECKEHFNGLKIAVELILDDAISKIEKEKNKKK